MASASAILTSGEARQRKSARGLESGNRFPLGWSMLFRAMGTKAQKILGQEISCGAVGRELGGEPGGVVFDGMMNSGLRGTVMRDGNRERWSEMRDKERCER